MFSNGYGMPWPYKWHFASVELRIGSTVSHFPTP